MKKFRKRRRNSKSKRRIHKLLTRSPMRRRRRSRRRTSSRRTRERAVSSAVPRIPSDLRQAATIAGRIHGYEYAQQQGEPEKMPRSVVADAMQVRFASFVERHRPSLSYYEWVKAMAEVYRDGFAGTFFPQVADTVLVPTSKQVDVVLCACKEEKSISAVLQQLQRLAIANLFIVINGSDDSTFSIAEEHAKPVTIIHYSDPLGHNVGRSIGAKQSHAEIVLFMDGDLLVRAEQLAPFIWAVESGVDIALTNITPFLGHFGQQDGISHCKQWLNRCLGRKDLYANSLTTVPHALSRRAIQTVGEPSLRVPPKVQALAIVRGLQVKAVQDVDVITNKRVSPSSVEVALILDNHMEAFRTLAAEGALHHRDNAQRIRIARRRNAK